MESRRKSKQLELPLVQQGEAREHGRSGESMSAKHGKASSGNHSPNLLEWIVSDDNIMKAVKKVKKNKGKPGVDGMTVEELGPHLRKHWKEVRSALLSGTYRPSAIRKAEIKKSGGGTRTLGIPTVLDRTIQQAILQRIQPEIDATFSNHSYAYRPGRSAHDAVRASRQFIQNGKSWVTDVDLSKYFDTVNHDILMSRMSKLISDKRVLKLIGRYLRAGIMVDGVVFDRDVGTPQGGPLSPLLANVYLDGVDKELEKRGLAFCRYADDCNVYTSSERAANDVMASLQKLYSRIHLTINPSKSAVAPSTKRKFLSYRFCFQGKSAVSYVADEAFSKMRARVREITNRNAGRSIPQVVAALAPYLKGWRAYFSLDLEKHVFRKLDHWIRDRLRVIELRQWRRGRTVYKRLRARGVNPDASRIVAYLRPRYWHAMNSTAVKIAMPDTYYTGLGLPMLLPE
jgi:RNA-directed DNA polymerase